MASIYNERGHPAEVAAMREIVFRYHPDFRALSKHTRTIFLEQANRGTQNIPMFLEQCVSYVSGLRRSNVPGEDHEDGSDTKFVTIRRGLNGGKFGYTAGIGNLANKRGTLRVVVYIEPRRTFQYFVIPYAGWSVLTCKNGQDIRLSYNRQTGRVSKIWPFEVSSFAQLCGDAIRMHREVFHPGAELQDHIRLLGDGVGDVDDGVDRVVVDHPGLEDHPGIGERPAPLRLEIGGDGGISPAWRTLFLRYADRIMIGTDTYVTSRWDSYGRLIDEHRKWLTHLPKAAAEAIAWRNAQRLFGALRAYRRPLLLVVLPIIAVIGGVKFYLSGGRYVTTDDAYVGAQKVLRVRRSLALMLWSTLTPKPLLSVVPLPWEMKLLMLPTTLGAG